MSELKPMKRILVIDDEEWLREMILLALRQKGYEPVEAANGTVGIEKARKLLPDLILCDVNMEKLDGYGTLSSLRSEPATAAIPFILMTGAADNAGMRHGMELGADDYLPKPFTIEALYAAVETRLKKVQTLRDEAEKQLADLRDNITMMLPHELRTPLNGILAYGEILSTDSASLQPAEIAEMGQIIHESGKRLERLIENFLIYSQIELIGKDPQRISALRKKQTQFPRKIIEARATHHAQEAGRTADLALDLIDKPAAISEEYLTRIVDELVHNAFKFSKPGTAVQVSLFPSAKTLTLSIADRGRGLGTEHVTRVGAYMQFERKLQEQQGLGLGLAIAKRLTELHGGNLAIQTEKNVRTTVVVNLPLVGASDV
jgi:two-component system, sensor histidine kinase and response regulator